MDRSFKPMIVRHLDAGGFVRVNRDFVEALGLENEDLCEKPLLEWLHHEDRAAFSLQAGNPNGQVRARHTSRLGEWIEFDWRFGVEDGCQVALGTIDVTYKGGVPHLKGSSFAEDSDSLKKTLDAMVRVIEDNHPDKKCSVVLLCENTTSVSVGAGPSLPSDYNAAVEGMTVGPTVGSCGTAAYWSVPVIVEDIQTDPLWRNYREHAAKAGVHSCWSHPITDRQGATLGALAFYGARPATPSLADHKALEMAANLLGLTVERGIAERALRKSEAAAHVQARLLSSVTEIMTLFVDRGDWQAAMNQLVQSAIELTQSRFGFVGMARDGGLELTWLEPQVLSGRIGAERELTLAILASDGPIHSTPALLADVQAALPEQSPKIHSFLCCPIRQGGSVVAVIGLANRSFGYRAEESRIVEFLCRTGSALFDSHMRRSRERSLEGQLIQAAKMEALGVLAGGIAHDFNNMLVSVMGNAELAMTSLENEAESRHRLEEIVTASARATELCNQMLAYAGRGVQSTETLELSSLISELGSLLRVALPKKATLEYELQAESIYLQADKTQVRQVIMNLITNAAEALPLGEGKILVSTSMRRFQRTELAQFHSGESLSERDYVELQVTDNGAGMSSATQARIFDPFFTTKFAGRGLGLAAVQGIVRAHRGGIRMESTPEVGTTFTVILPSSKAPLSCANKMDEQSQDHAGKRVLLVDDEPEVRNVLCMILERSGFEVLCATDGAHAIEIYSRDPESIDCVLLDLSMPKLDGEETFRELKRIRPDVRVVINSGYTEREMLQRFQGAGFAGFLQKPAPMNSLVGKLHEVMNQK